MRSGWIFFYLVVLLLLALRQEVQARSAWNLVSGRIETLSQLPLDLSTRPPNQEKIDEIMKDCERLPGLLTLYRRVEDGRLRLYAEIKEEQIDYPFLLQSTLSTSSSQSEIAAGMPIRDLILKFCSTPDDRLLLVAPDLWHRAEKGALSTAVARDFPASYLGIFRVTARQAERRSLLIDISDLFQDAITWPASRRQGTDLSNLDRLLLDDYDWDANKSFISSITCLPDRLVIVVQ